MATNPYQKYKEQSIMTMTQGELLNVLFETCVKRMNAAVLYIEEKRYDLANENIKKSINIIRYLDETLDKSYEISDNLAALYDFFIYQLTNANVKKDAEMIKEIIPMVDDLGKAFKEADITVRKKGA